MVKLYSHVLASPDLIRGSTNSFNLFVDGRIKSGQGDKSRTQKVR